MVTRLMLPAYFHYKPELKSPGRVQEALMWELHVPIELDL